MMIYEGRQKEVDARGNKESYESDDKIREMNYEENISALRLHWIEDEDLEEVVKARAPLVT